MLLLPIAMPSSPSSLHRHPSVADLPPLPSTLSPASCPRSQLLHTSPAFRSTSSSECTLAISPDIICSKSTTFEPCDILELAGRNGIPSPLTCITPTKLRCTGQASHSTPKRPLESEAGPLKRRRTILGEHNGNQVSLSKVNSHIIEDVDNPCAKVLSPRSFGRIIKGKEDRIQECPRIGTGFCKEPRKLGSSPLKGKRPPKLDIPSGTTEETARNLQPEIGTNCQSIEEYTCIEDPHYGVACKKGKREIMEDTYTVSTNLQGNSKQAFFGVFDGHGGRMAADYASENLTENMNAALSDLQDMKDGIEKAVSAAYLSTDAGFLAKGIGSGASSVTAFFHDGCVVVANAGDCRAVLSRAGKAEALTNDHRPSKEEERKRIENLGGYVDCFNGVWRVQGVLAVSRGFGDLNLKEWISAEPEVKKLVVTPDCEFLILASDGLWDKISNQEAVDCARQHLLRPLVGTETLSSSLSRSDDGNGEVVNCSSNSTMDSFSSPQKRMVRPTSMGLACKKLVEMAVKRGGQDDISVVIVDLPHFCTSLS